MFHSAESFPRGSLYCCNNFRYRKNLDKSGGSIKIFRGKFFCLTVPKNFVGEPFCAVFQKNSGSEKFMDKRGGEFQDFQSKIFCLTVPKNSVGEAFAVAIISGIEKIWIRVGGVSRFSVENFLSHSDEKFRRAILHCCNNFGYRKSLDKKGGGIKIFRRKFFCLTVPKNFVGEPFCAVFQKISGSEKFMDKRGGGGVSSFSIEIFLFHSAESFPRGSLYCCNNFRYRKNLDKSGGSIKIFRGKFFVSQCRKIS